MFKILYFGKDDAFFHSFEEKLKQEDLCQEISIEKKFFKDDEEKSKIASLVGEIAQASYGCLFVDFAVDKDAVSLLARHLRLSLNPEQVGLIGLLNQVGDDNKGVDKNLIKKDFLQASLTHIPIIHYKGMSLSHLLFDALYLSRGDAKTRKKLATFSNLFEEVNAKYFSSITHIMDQALILESSLEFSKSDVVKFESDFLAHINNKHLFVVDQKDDLLQTKFKHRYRFSMVEPKKDIDELMSKDDKKNKDPNSQWDDPQYRLVDIKSLSNYIASIDKSGSNKRAKLLLVQSGLEVLAQMEESLNDLPYLIRYQTAFRSDLKIIKNFRPNIVALEINEGDEVEVLLKSLIDAIKEINDYNPVVMIFKIDIASEKLKEFLDYQFIMVHKGKIDLSLLLNMMEIFDKKLGDFDPSDKDPLIMENESTFNVYALNPISRVKLDLEIYLSSISEHELTFFSKEELPMRGIVFVDKPVKMYLTVLPEIDALEKKNGYFHYYAVINGITTVEIQILRQYINELFTREKHQKEREEKEAFKKMNHEKKNSQDKDEK